jgi:hypothetical protein
MAALLKRCARSLWFWIGLFFVAYVVWDVTGYPRGMLGAYIDHAQGIDAAWDTGHLPSYELEYRQMLRTRYGVEMRGSDSTFVLHAVSSYMDGYNGVSHRYAVEKYGKDIFKECGDEASEHMESNSVQLITLDR